MCLIWQVESKNLIIFILFSMSKTADTFYFFMDCEGVGRRNFDYNQSKTLMPIISVYF